MPGMFYYCTLDCRGLERRNAHYLMSIWGSSRLCCGKEDYSTLRKKPTSNTHRKVVKWVSKEVEKSSSWEALSNEKHWEMRLAGIKCSPHPLHKPSKSQHWREQQQKTFRLQKNQQNPQPTSSTDKTRTVFARKVLPGVIQGLKNPLVQEPFLSAFQTSLWYSHEQYPVHCAAGQSMLGEQDSKVLHNLAALTDSVVPLVLSDLISEAQHILVGEKGKVSARRKF